MIYGQDFAYQYIYQLIDSFVHFRSVPGFVLLSGSEHIGKWTLLIDVVQKLCPHVTQADIRILYDCSGISDYQSKTHTIKIQTTDSGSLPTIVHPDYGLIYDYGIRELQSRLTISPAGSYKIALIQNIERLTTSASNAMLKILEEPLDNRMIIATTSHIQTLLPTIISRAQCVQAYLATDSQVDQYLTNLFPMISIQTRKHIVQLSAGAIGIAHQLASYDPSQVAGLMTDCQIASDANMFSIYRVLKSHQKYQTIDLYLSVLQSYADHHHQYDMISALTQYRKYIDASVNTENALLNLALQLSYCHTYKNL